MKYLLKFVIALWLLLIGIAYSYQPTPSGGNATTQPKGITGKNGGNIQENNYSTQNASATIEISKAPIIQVETTDKTHKTRDYSSSEWWLVYLTGGLAAFTVALAIFTFRLWKANISLIESSRTQDRAYLIGDGPEVFVKVGETLARRQDSIITIHNAGRTPGFCTRLQWKICDAEDFLFDEKVSQILSDNLIEGRLGNIIEEDNVWPAGEKFGLDHFKITDHSSHVGRILFGRVDFKDIFGDSHYSTFKLKLIDSGSRTLPGSYSDDWA